jgi:hypothetical protein
MGRIIMIPMKPHIRQYFKSRFGEVPKANLNNIIGRVLDCTWNHVAMNRRALNDLVNKAILKVELTSARIIHKQWDKDRLMRSGNVLEKHFEEALIAFIIGFQFTPEGQNVHKAVRIFCEIYEIDEDMVSIDTLRKVWRDHQAREAKREYA